MVESLHPISSSTDQQGMRARLRAFLTSRRFEAFITAIIAINAITLGMETSKAVMAAIGPALLVFDKLVLGIFVVEILLKLFAFGGRFFRSGWNWFDLIIVGISLMPASGALSVLRALRILRVLRLISVVPALRRVVGALVEALPGMGSIIVLMGLVFYVFAVMSTKLFGAAFPDWFGSVGASAYSLFQIMTLESWSMGIVRPVMETYSWAWAFFVPFILSTSFVVLNLFIGIIVSAMQAEHEAEANDDREALRDQNTQILEEMRAMRSEMEHLRRENGREQGKELGNV
ncbi:MAG: ion transporter [Pseudomonadota bacterium]